MTIHESNSGVTLALPAEPVAGGGTARGPAAAAAASAATGRRLKARASENPRAPALAGGRCPAHRGIMSRDRP